MKPTEHMRDELAERRAERRAARLRQELIRRGVAVIWIEQLQRFVTPVFTFTGTRRPGAA